MGIAKNLLCFLGNLVTLQNILFLFSTAEHGWVVFPAMNLLNFPLDR